MVTCDRCGSYFGPINYRIHRQHGCVSVNTSPWVKRLKSYQDKDEKIVALKVQQAK